jgi:thymidine phosphorylase
VVLEVKAPRAGHIAKADSRILGEVVRDLGGGRMTKEAAVDFDVGLDRLVAVSETVKAGEPLCRIHARTVAEAEGAQARVLSAFEISSAPVPKPPLVVEIL